MRNDRVCDAISKSASQRGSRLIARILDLLMPGVGLFYWERRARGSRFIVFWVAYLMLILFSWLWRPFHSDFLILYIVLPWSTLTIWLWHEVAIAPPAELKWVRHIDRMSTSLGLVVLAWLPLFLTLQLIFSRALLWVRVSDDSMFPTIISGDLLSIDRRVNRVNQLRPGSLIAVECRGVGPTIMRLITYASRQTLEVELDELGGIKAVELPSVQPSQEAMGEPIQTGLILLDQILKARLEESDRIETWLDSVVVWEPHEDQLIRNLLWSQAKPISPSQTSYPFHLVAVRRYQDPQMKAQRLRILPGQILVLPDLRDPNSRAMSCGGVTSSSRILGEVKYIQSQDREAYARRRGLSLLR